MSAITTLRASLAAALTDSSYSTYAFPNPLPLEGVEIIPDDPYIEPQNNQHATIAPLANFRLRLAVQSLDNQSSLKNIETMMVTVFNKLAASSFTYNVTSISAPSLSSEVGSELLVSEMSVSILTTWS